MDNVLWLLILYSLCVSSILAGVALVAVFLGAIGFQDEIKERFLKVFKKGDKHD